MHLCNICMRCWCTLDEKAVGGIRELQVRLDDFDRVKLIGRGAFGAVQLVSMYLEINVFVVQVNPTLWAPQSFTQTFTHEENKKVFVRVVFGGWVMKENIHFIQHKSLCQCKVLMKHATRHVWACAICLSSGEAYCLCVNAFEASTHMFCLL